MDAPVARCIPLSTSLKVEFGASMVSWPFSIVTSGFTGALFIRVAGIGGMICAGSCWTGAGAAALVDFFRTAFLWVGGFWTSAACEAVCQAQARSGVNTSTLVMAIALFIAGSRLAGKLTRPILNRSTFWMHLYFCSRLRICFFCDSADISACRNGLPKANIYPGTRGIYSAWMQDVQAAF